MNQGEMPAADELYVGRIEGVYQEIKNNPRYRRLAVGILIMLDLGFGKVAGEHYVPNNMTESVAVAAEGELLDTVTEPEPEPIPPYEEVFDVDRMVPPETELPERHMPYEVYAENAKEIINNIPSLDVLGTYFPGSPMTSDIENQKRYINELDAVVHPTVEKYEAFTIDTSRADVFRGTGSYDQHIDPKLYIVHWTAGAYTDVDHLIRALGPNRVLHFMDENAQASELFESHNNKPAHALGANPFSQGVEVETGHYDGINSPLFSYTPDQIENTVYLGVRFLRSKDIPIDETTFISHYAADLIFVNPFYDPHTGKFTRKSIRKFDPPQELMEVIVRKAQELDALLGPVQ